MIKGRILLKSYSTNPDYTLLTAGGYAVVKQESTQTDLPIGALIEADSENAAQISEITDPVAEKQIDSFLDQNAKAKKGKPLRCRGPLRSRMLCHTARTAEKDLELALEPKGINRCATAGVVM